MNKEMKRLWKQVQVLHELLGDEYLDTMDAHGVRRPPAVVWESRGLDTVACVFWENAPDEEVRGFPRDMLATEVARRVLARMGSGN